MRDTSLLTRRRPPPSRHFWKPPVLAVFCVCARREEMTQEEFNTLRGVTNKSRVDTALYASAAPGKGSKAATAAAAAAASASVDDMLLGTQQSTTGTDAAGAGAGAKGVRAAGDTMFYRITCKVCGVLHPRRQCDVAPRIHTPDRL